VAGHEIRVVASSELRLGGVSSSSFFKPSYRWLNHIRDKLDANCVPTPEAAAEWAAAA
jgi:hypothetical protein